MDGYSRSSGGWWSWSCRSLMDTLIFSPPANPPLPSPAFPHKGGRRARRVALATGARFDRGEIDESGIAA